ncbi:MAG: AMP-binding protein [Bacteroidota bacterium]
MNKDFQLDGRSFDRDQLLEYCHRGAGDKEYPEWKKEVLAFIDLFLDPSRGEVIQKTSGTTGDPRIHILHRQSLIRSARKTLDFFKLAPGDRVLHCLPMRYVAGKLMVVRALVGGLDLVLTEPSGRPARDLKEALAFAAMVPLQVHESLVHGDDFANISTLLIGGGKLQYASLKHLSRLEQTAVYESFGMSETYTHFALKRISGPNPDRGFRVFEGVEISQDQRNCLVVDVQGITEGPVTTNDLVEIDPSGQMFKWLGRYDHVINSGGIKIIPEMLEQQIRLVIRQNSLVLPEPDDRLGSRLVLLVETTEENPPLEEWFEAMKAILPAYELPKHIYTTPEIPRNSSMKMDRLAAQKFLPGH